VLKRYIDIIAARVDGLGGDSGSIAPSPTGAPPRPGGGHHGDERRTYVGKVEEVSYDCFGDFTGFLLTTCASQKRFHDHRRGIERVALRACRHDLTVVVTKEADHDESNSKDARAEQTTHTPRRTHRQDRRAALSCCCPPSTVPSGPARQTPDVASCSRPSAWSQPAGRSGSGLSLRQA
jgi:hypothetical protein